MEIMFRSVTRQNFSAVMNTKTAPGQENYVASNACSVAEVYIEPTWTPLAMYAEDEVVVFAKFGPDEATGRWWLIRFMIGAAHQGKGYGMTALRALIALMVERHACREIYLGYEPGNDVAERLYARAGFVPTGEIEDGEIVVRLDVG